MRCGISSPAIVNFSTRMAIRRLVLPGVRSMRVDLNTGKYLWKIPLGEYPELAAKGMKDNGF